ncbi:hypothetical protein CAEBREN_05347 [Caenorhabditis brenneri]|uniref:Uncharacterized protein n=1 Tax=Caenorhabditis brenneri TaxID=135651 RepID=G0NEH4_CAEBE|nr:hypothetical protein CAEBREN_05347 [Caenorhabditis brenneri]
MSAITITLIAVTKIFNLITISHGYQLFFFAVSWPTVNLASTRAILVVIITLDRALAVFSPIFYHNNRSKFPNVFLIFCVFCYPVLDNMMLWVYCQYDLTFPPGCVSVGCLMNQCFLQYSLDCPWLCWALATKLFIWNHYKNRSRSKDLERANHLALIDAATIFIFDVVPILILIGSHKFEYVGTCLAFTKAAGYTLEGGLVYRTLKRKNETAMNTIVGNSVVAIKANSFH